MEITLKVDQGLIGAINNLAAAMSGKGNQPQTTNVFIPADSSSAIANPVQTSIPGPEQVQTYPQLVPPPAAPPVQAPPPPPPAPAAVPTAAPTYTVEQLAVSATQLVDAGRSVELRALLAQFGVAALTALGKEHYGAFATKLREMGARI